VQTSAFDPKRRSPFATGLGALGCSNFVWGGGRKPSGEMLGVFC
jgi:hypothetical protein